MIKPPSQQFEYTLIFSGDPSLNLPANTPENPTARERALEVARETGQWEALVHPGEMPTLFHVKPLGGAVFDWLVSEARRRNASEAEMHVLALRLALTKVDGLGEHKVTTEAAGFEGEFRIASTKIIDALYSIEGVGRVVVQELGSLVWQRATGGLRPKS
jgi:hypothetical protein